jgi:hypothetical protein
MKAAQNGADGLLTEHVMTTMSVVQNMPIGLLGGQWGYAHECVVGPHPCQLDGE